MIRIVRLFNFWLLDESHQPGGSFKSRGVKEQMRSYILSKRARTIVTFSSGNHGIAVALYARGIVQAPIVVVPRWVEATKLEILKLLGCRVMKSGDTASECERYAYSICEEVSGFFAHPYRSYEQIVGYTSLWSEIAQIFQEGADVIVPVGSGGLLAAGVLYRSEKNAMLNIIGAEPTRCASLARAYCVGKPETVFDRSHSAPALNVDVTPNEVFEIVNSVQDVSLFQVTDEEIALCTAYLNDNRMAVDPGAATAMAVAFFRTVPRKYKHLVVILTGGGAENNLTRFRAEGLIHASKSEIETAIGMPKEMCSFQVSTVPETPSGRMRRRK